MTTFVATGFAVLAAFLPVPAGDGLQRAIELVRAGDLHAALAAADAETDPLARSQARVYVIHHAGDLDGALAVARRAVAEHPDDPWLAERLVFVATSLRRLEPAREGLARLETAAARAPESERERWTTLARSSRTDVETLARAHDRAHAARARARGVTLGIGLLGVAVLALLSRAAWTRERHASDGEFSKTSRNRTRR